MAAEKDSRTNNTVHVQLTLVRHGETQANKEQILQGQLDTPLSELGCRQSRLVGQRLAAAETITHIYCSDLCRTVRTAELIVEELGYPVKIEQDAHLRERAYGEHEGKPIIELIMAARARGVAVKDYTVSGGESLNDVHARVREFLAELFSTYCTHDDVLKMREYSSRRKRHGFVVDDSHPLPDVHTLVVSHGGTIFSIFEYLREVGGVRDIAPSSSGPTTPNAAISSFLLTFRDGRCNRGRTLVTHSTQHLT